MLDALWVSLITLPPKDPMVTLYCRDILFLDGGRLMARGRVGIDFVVPALIPSIISLSPKMASAVDY